MKWLWILVVAGCVTSCGSNRESAEEGGEERATAPSRTAPPARFSTIGRVASVDADDGFVLVHKTKKVTLPAGTTLTSYGESGERTNLRLSGERMGFFAVADVLSGEVAVGDTVQMLQVPKVVPGSGIPENGAVKTEETLPNGKPVPLKILPKPA